MSYTASVAILSVISLERFVAIVYPMHSRRVRSMTLLRLTIVGVWTVAAASGLPFVAIYDTMDIPYTGSDNSTMQYCIMVPDHSMNIRAYTCAMFVLWYASPLAMMAFVYARISVVLWHSSHGPRVMLTTAPPPATLSTFVVNHDVIVTTSQPSNMAQHCGRMSSVVLAGSVRDHHDSTYASSGRKLRRAREGRWLRRIHQRHSARHQHHLTPPQCLISVDPRSDDAGQGSALELRSLKSDHKIDHQVSAMVANTDQTALGARRKVIRLMIAVVASFAVCVLPYHVRVLWQAFCQLQLNEWHLIITPVTFVLYYLNSGLNPLLYALLSNRFRSSLYTLLCCRCRGTTQVARNTYNATSRHVTRTVHIASV